MKSLVLRYAQCDTCGTFGVGRFFEDASYEQILSPCYHFGILPLPSRREILERIKNEEEWTETTHS